MEDEHVQHGEEPDLHAYEGAAFGRKRGVADRGAAQAERDRGEQQSREVHGEQPPAEIP